MFQPEVEELNLCRYMSYLLPTSGPAGSDLDRNRRHGTHLGFDLPQIKPGRVIRAGFARGPFYIHESLFQVQKAQVANRRDCSPVHLSIDGRLRTAKFSSYFY